MKEQRGILFQLFIWLRKTVKVYFDRIRNEHMREQLLKAIPFWGGSLLVGGIAVFYAKLFQWADQLFLTTIHHREWLLFIIMPVCFVGAWWLVKQLQPYAAGSGIPQVMAALERSNTREQYKIRKLLSIRIILVKAASSIVMVLGGGAVGREGPTIQIAASVFKKINDLLPQWWPKIANKNMILTGAAAGLSAAFNTPLGGIVFAVEELTKVHFKYFKTAIFTAVIIAGLTAQQLLGPYLYLGYPKINSISNVVFFAVLLVSVVTGISAAYIARMIMGIFRWKQRFKNNGQHLLFLVLSALTIASIGYFVSGAILGSGKDLMEHYLFTGDKHAPAYAPLLRTIGTTLSFTSGAAGGIFAPALSIGATIGSSIAGWFNFSNTDTNVLILAGMVAFLTGITRAPFTSAILVLEMTDRHSLILHLMTAAIVANFATILFSKHALYDWLKQRYLHQLKTEEPEDANDRTTRV
ncbi:chloride channel protein [Niabella drilacis]|uniref:H+/Cl-antiporter ClcA n=1 Tax=Niabella drilacis (strain DSM 25811 / CCM 8410 / CCUG 62505 / LMG 26954 / E90) TaxID=1285928 RepID=A0A1G6NY76_NIADE|nr:chloride channel protein [Niabella drilacis]SDC72187.1 H+/Cl-antiporter ClcA [Niabella drilacis]